MMSKNITLEIIMQKDNKLWSNTLSGIYRSLNASHPGALIDIMDDSKIFICRYIMSQIEKWSCLAVV